MVLTSSLSRGEYLSAMKDMMSAHAEFGVERFTGFFLGPWFYVTHHSAYQWNRKISSQKNAALGRVKQTESGCKIHFLRFRGPLCPLVALSLLLAGFAVAVVSSAYVGLVEELGIRDSLLVCLAVVGISLALILPIATLFECMTEESEDGRRMLLSLLHDPVHPYENLPHIL